MRTNLRLARVDEAQLPAGADSEPGVVPVVPGLLAADGGHHRRVFELAYAEELVPHKPCLDLELVGVVDVLPLAAGARAVVGAGRRHPVGRGLEHFLDFGLPVAPALAPHLGDDLLTRDGAGDEDRLPFMPGQPPRLGRPCRRWSR